MIRFILADLRRLWAASLVIVALVALATALGVTVTLQERTLRLGSARAADKFDLVVGAPGSETQLVLSSVFLQPAPLVLLPGEVLHRLSADPRVAWVAPIGFGDGYKGYPIVGTTTVLVSGTTTGFLDGQMFAKEGEALIGSAVKLEVGSEVHPMHLEAGGQSHEHKELAYRVVGRLKPTDTAWDRAILVPIQAVWHLHGLGVHHDADHAAEADHHDDHDDDHDEDHDEHHHGHLDPAAPIDENWQGELPGSPALLVKPKTIGDAYKLRQEYRSNHETLAVFPAEVLTRLYSTLGDARKVLMYVAYGAEGLVAASLMLITLIHVNQRRRQIGALRAFGAPRGAVFGIVWGELFAIVVVGVGAGFGIGYTVAKVLAVSFTADSGVALPIEFTTGDLGTAALLLGFAAVLSALPALIAYRQPPAKALRS